MQETTWTADRVAEYFRRVDLEKDTERRARFVPFGIPTDCLWPASRLYHQHSKLEAANQPGLPDAAIEKLTLTLDYKAYPEAPRVALPPTSALGGELEAALSKRRSARTFAQAPMRLVDLAKLLALGAGVVDPPRSDQARPRVGSVVTPDDVPRRSAPSGGGLYPVEVYAIALAVEDLPEGVYHYAPLDNVLEEVRLGPPIGLERCMRTALDGSRPPVIIVMTAVFARTQLKYLERGYRFALLEAGHIGQNLTLVATALGLDSVCIGGFDDDPLNALLGLSTDDEAAIYALFVGRGSPSKQRF